MGNRDIKKSEKKKKKADIINTPTTSVKPIMVQPELIKKEKKNK